MKMIMDGSIMEREEVISTLEKWLKSKADQGLSSFTNEETATQFSKAVSEAVRLLRAHEDWEKELQKKIYTLIKKETSDGQTEDE